MADLLTNSKQLYQGQLSASETTLATVGSGKKWIILHFVVTNTDTEEHTFGLSCVPNGGTAGDANRIISSSTVIAAGDTFSSGDLFIVMDTAGDFLSGIADEASELTVTISGCEV